MHRHRQRGRNNNDDNHDNDILTRTIRTKNDDDTRLMITTARREAMCQVILEPLGTKRMLKTPTNMAPKQVQPCRIRIKALWYLEGVLKSTEKNCKILYPKPLSPKPCY